MKKWFIYISLLTVVTLLAGVLFVYGAFNFASGKAQLIGGTRQESSEKIMHDQIVRSIHDIGNQVRGLPTSDFEDIIEPTITKLESLKTEAKSINDLFTNNSFTKRQKPIKEGYSEIYEPALSQLTETYSAVLTVCLEFENLETAEVDKFSQYAKLSIAKEDFIKAHNDYTIVINAKRKY